MRALIMSDSHGWENDLKVVVDRHRAEVDAIFHCGDSELSATSPALENVFTVRGNCDHGSDFPEEIVETVNGTTFFVGHGHLLNVKMTEMNLIYKGEEASADILCYGHTHIPVATEEKGKIIINPGSMRLPRQYNVGSYVIVDTSDTAVNVNFYSIKGQRLDDLSKSFSKNG
ncbi:metallophosphoesterase [Salipaludibacillus sp. LMS25]|jgi:putative phosphoesterase|uniref:metallophosphoesterase family protein n=1 Tax=Salipaludibacillus sp. LMS25 TaxID=2924031 RepID=UPI0020D06323|nr:metallophosphoesterase [Salipaludibacillus sp. LMS25]UTR15519.1 metallophosphoesterase [Salipaludibacillus sp. LMS25]